MVSLINQKRKKMLKKIKDKFEQWALNTFGYDLNEFFVRGIPIWLGIIAIAITIGGILIQWTR